MKLQRARREIDMCNGPLLRNVFAFSLPLMLTSILQLLYNAADTIIVGRFGGSTALAAVGSTGPLINLIVNLFIGLSVGSNVLVARFHGAGDRASIDDAVHTSVALSLISGVAVGLFGFFASRTLLQMMDTPENVLEPATLYLRIYFIGMPVTMFYNFASAILRAVGDTKRPLYYLTVSGIVNVVLNLFFVIVLRIDVAGVAIATVISQVVASAMILRQMMQATDSTHLNLRRLRLGRQSLLEITRIGLPAGLQNTLFSLSNVLIQSSVNSFGSIVMAGHAASGNIITFLSTSLNAVSQATLTFTSQNIGAKRYDRILRILGTCVLMTTVLGLALGGLIYLFGRPLLSLYTTEPEVTDVGMMRILYEAVFFFICGIMGLVAGSVRGCGYSVAPMIVTLLGACGLRIVWVYTIFAAFPTLPVLYLSYPVSWILTTIAHLIYFFYIWRKMPHDNQSIQATA